MPADDEEDELLDEEEVLDELELPLELLLELEDELELELDELLEVAAIPVLLDAPPPPQALSMVNSSMPQQANRARVPNSNLAFTANPSFLR